MSDSQNMIKADILPKNYESKWPFLRAYYDLFTRSFAQNFFNQLNRNNY